jgi:NADPH:quinone reductase-like Zn-dependent oxidoreductase
MIGFASGIEAEEVPLVAGRALCFGNFDLLGVILSYVDDALAPFVTPYAPVPVPRFNPPTATIGQRVHAHLLELLDRGRIRPVVGRRVPFDGLPQALEDMEARSTTGRIVLER